MERRWEGLSDLEGGALVQMPNMAPGSPKWSSSLVEGFLFPQFTDGEGEAGSSNTPRIPQLVRGAAGIWATCQALTHFCTCRPGQLIASPRVSPNAGLGFPTAVCGWQDSLHLRLARYGCPVHIPRLIASMERTEKRESEEDPR